MVAQYTGIADSAGKTFHVFPWARRSSTRVFFHGAGICHVTALKVTMETPTRRIAAARTYCFKIIRTDKTLRFMGTLTFMFGSLCQLTHDNVCKKDTCITKRRAFWIHAWKNKWQKIREISWSNIYVNIWKFHRFPTFKVQNVYGDLANVLLLAMCTNTKVHLQIEDQVVVSFFWYAVMETHCGGEKREITFIYISSVRIVALWRDMSSLSVWSSWFHSSPSGD